MKLIDWLCGFYVLLAVFQQYNGDWFLICSDKWVLTYNWFEAYFYREESHHLQKPWR